MHTFPAGPGHDARESSSTAEVFPLRDIASSLWRGRWLVCAAALAAGFVGFGWAKSQPPIYQAMVAIKVGDLKMSEGGQRIAPLGYTVLLANRTLAKKLIDEFKLDQRYDATPAGLLAIIKLSEDRNASLVYVRVGLDDPALAAQLANRFAEHAIELNRTLNQRDTTLARDLVKVQLDEAGVRLESARKAMLAFRRSAQIELNKADVTAVVEQRQELADWAVVLASEKARLAQLERDLAAQPATVAGERSASADADIVAAINRSAREGEQQEFAGRSSKSTRPEPSPQGAERRPEDEARLRDEAQRRAEVRRAAQELRRPEDVPVLPAGDLRANPVRMLLEYQVSAARSRVAGLERRQQELADVLKLDGPRVRNLERLYQAEEELRRLELEVRVAEKAYSDLSQRYEQARLDVAARSADLQIVDPALVPRRPSTWSDTSVALVSVLLGAIATMGALAIFALVRSWRVG